MFTIRRDQIEAMTRAMTVAFVDRAVEHVRDALPDEYAATGEDAVRDSIWFAIRQTRQYGFVDEYDVVRYLNLMYLLGFHFDADPGLPWVRDVLDGASVSPRASMDLLTAKAIEELERRRGST